MAFFWGEEVGGRVGGVSGGGGGCESDQTSTPVEMCRWGGAGWIKVKLTYLDTNINLSDRRSCD
jgi:hypothetical protein